MKKFLFFLFLLPAFFSHVLTQEERLKGLAFLPFENLTGDSNSDYLSELVPNSLSSSFRDKSDRIIVATESAREISDDFTTDGVLRITHHDYKKIAGILSAEYLIHGSFSEKQGLKLFTIVVYNAALDEFISFERSGNIDSETEIFGLVDKLKTVLMNMAKYEYIYKTEIIKPNSKIAVFSNLTGPEYNILISEFMKAGHTISSVQANDNDSVLTGQQMDFFYNLPGKTERIEKRTEPFKLELISEPWKSEQTLKKEKSNFEQTGKMVYFSGETNISALKLISDRYGSVDYFFFINASFDKKRLWVRCINTDSWKIVWIESHSLPFSRNISKYADTARSIIAKYGYISN